MRIEILKKIEAALPRLEASHAAEHAREQQLLNWARAERDRIGLRPLAGRLRTDPANLAKVLAGSRPANRALLASIMTQMPQA